MRSPSAASGIAVIPISDDLERRSLAGRVVIGDCSIRQNAHGGPDLIDGETDGKHVRDRKSYTCEKSTVK